MEKKWKITKNNFEKNKIDEIAKHFNCPLVIAELLVQRDFDTIEKIQNFFEPSIDDLYDPFLFKDMEKSVSKIVEKINNQELITIYGDYDVDGITSTALLFLGIKKIGGLVDYFLPNRMVEGYGLSKSAIDEIKQNGTSLIVTVDCGINGNEEVEYIKESGMDIIITDHHNPKEELPKSLGIINPKIKDTLFPFNALAGVGVAYQLLMAIYKKTDNYSYENRKKYLDFVAVGTIADIVPLVDENRILATIGLRQLTYHNNIGLKALARISGLKNKEIKSSDVVFGLAPRLNAAGRMGSAHRALELLISEKNSSGYKLAEIVERENSLRKLLDTKTFEEACYKIEKKYKNLDDVKFIVISSDDWHSGVIGIVASKLVEKYFKPAIIITFKDGVGRGSGRSIPGFSIFDALMETEDLVISFGGHKYAAGLNILADYLEPFEKRLQEYAEEHITDKELIPTINISKQLELHQINMLLLNWLEKFAPYGPKNMRPIFCSKRVLIKNYPYIVGTNHLKLKVDQGGHELDLIGFNLGHLLPFLRKNSYIDIVYSLDINNWRNRSIIQGKLRDINFEA